MPLHVPPSSVVERKTFNLVVVGLIPTVGDLFFFWFWCTSPAILRFANGACAKKKTPENRNVVFCRSRPCTVLREQMLGVEIKFRAVGLEV